MIRSCLFTTALYVATAAGYFAVFRDRYDDPAPWVAALVGACVSLLGFGFLSTAWRARKEARVLDRVTAGGRPVDGQPWVASGSIHPLGAPLSAPFSSRPCVLYAYEVYHTDHRRSDHRRRSAKVKERTGFALTPSVVRGAVEPMRLLAFPSPDEFPSQAITSPEGRANARLYLARTEFLSLETFAPGRMYREIRDILTDDDGAVRKDWRLTRKEPDLDRSELAEIIVPVGAEVSVIGIYSAERQGLISDLAAAGTVIRIHPGAATAFARRQGKSASASAIGGVLLLLATQLGLWGLLERRQSFYAPQRQDALIAAAREGDVPQVARLLRLGARVDQQAQGTTALIVAADAATTRLLLEQGADPEATDDDGQTPLVAAARSGELDKLRALIAAGANLDRKGAAGAQTALVAALDAEQEEAAAMLRAAGAADDTVTARNGQPITASPAGAEAGDGPLDVCRAWLAAVQAEDPNRLRALSVARPRNFFEGIDFGAWKGARILDPALVEGHFNERAATLTLRGTTGGGFEAVWVYQLAYRSGRWKIERERWRTRADEGAFSEDLGQSK